MNADGSTGVDSLAGEADFEEQRGEDGRLEFMINHTTGIVKEFDGPKGEERLVRKYRQFEFSYTYTGDPGKERLVQKVLGSGGNEIVMEYDEEERLRKKWTEHQQTVYAGPKDEEYMTKMLQRSGTLTEYVGPKGEERKVKRWIPDSSPLPGQAWYMSNDQGPFDDPERDYTTVRAIVVEYGDDEQVVKVTHPDGTVTAYEGSPYEEYAVKVTHPDGKKTKYDKADDIEVPQAYR